MRRRAALAVGAVVLGLVGGAVAARAVALERVEAALSRGGWRWSGREAGLCWVRWRGLGGPMGTAEAIEVEAGWPVKVGIDAPRLDLRALVPGRILDDRGLPVLPGFGVPAVLTVRGGEVRWGERTLVTDLAGRLAPELRLDGLALGGKLHADEERGRWTIRARPLLQDGPLRGRLAVELVRDGGADRPWSLTVHARRVRLDHPLLAHEALPPAPLSATARWDPTGALRGRVELGAVEAAFHGTLRPSPLSWDVQVSIDGTLSEICDLFGVPEARGALLAGSLGLDLGLSGPPLAWKATPRAQGLAAVGVVPDLDALRGGPFTWRCPDATGQPVPCSAGEGTPDWVPLDQAGWLAPAVLAAEDSAFWRHPGFDLDAIRAALHEWAAGARRPRGGSTLTEQLAKNLFLDGRRTLKRKLRELLYALDLEEALGKRRILELYLNVVPFGPGVIGAGPGARACFAKHPAALTPKEAAYLAALLPSPTRRCTTDRALDARVDAILRNMGDMGALAPDEVARERARPLVLIP